MSKAKLMEQTDLPLNYMGDYSLMGFIVTPFDKAVTAVVQSGFALERHEAVATILIHTPDDLLHLGQLFNQQGITWQYSDVAETIYQA